MSDSVSPVDIKVLGKDYRIACAETEREALLESAQYLDMKMREVRDTGRVVGQDRIAVMAALNITHELSQLKKSSDSLPEQTTTRVFQLNEKINSELERLESE